MSPRLSLTCCQIQDDSYGETALIKTLKVIERKKLVPELESFSKRHKYKCILDATLCLVIPELKKPCRDYYNGKGVCLVESFSPATIKHMDIIVSKVVRSGLTFSIVQTKKKKG